MKLVLAACCLIVACIPSDAADYCFEWDIAYHFPSDPDESWIYDPTDTLPTPHACQAICQSQERCNYWRFGPLEPHTPNICYLMSSKAWPGYPNPDNVSGPKFCEGCDCDPINKEEWEFESIQYDGSAFWSTEVAEKEQAQVDCRGKDRPAVCSDGVIEFVVNRDITRSIHIERTEGSSVTDGVEAGLNFFGIDFVNGKVTVDTTETHTTTWGTDFEEQKTLISDTYKCTGTPFRLVVCTVYIHRETITEAPYTITWRNKKRDCTTNGVQDCTTRGIQNTINYEFAPMVREEFV